MRLENESLNVGDLSLLGVSGITDNTSNIAQLNNVLTDATIDEGRDTTQLQNIGNTLIKLNSGSDLNQAEFTLLGLDNLSSEDVEDLNMALVNTNSLDLGDAPTSNLQTILDSLNRFDNGKTISLTDLSNIGVTGVGGLNQPSLATLNAELNGKENTDDIQTLVNTLQNREDVLMRLENESLNVGDLSLLGVTGVTENTSNIAQLNNVLTDITIDEGRDTTQLQNIANTLIKLNSGSDLSQAEFTLLGLDNLESEDVADLNMALANTNSLDLGDAPTTNLQTILDSLNRFDNLESISLTDLSNIGVTGIGGLNQPSLATLNSELNGKENTNDIQTLVNTLKNREDALIRLESEALNIGDLSLLGISGITDNTSNIAQLNNVLSDTTIDEGRDTIQLQNIADALIKLNNGSDLNQAEFTLLGLDNLESEDVADLNMALANTNSLALGDTPTTNLQTILDSLNRFDDRATVSLTDLSNIGVTGIGGLNQPSLATLNSELNGKENTNDIQNVVNNLTIQDSITRLSAENLILGDLSALGITGLNDNAENIARINNILEDSDVAMGSDVFQLQAMVDVIIKIDAKDGESTAPDITQEEWQLIGLNNVSSPDSTELNIALENINSLDLGIMPLTNLQHIEDSLNALDQVKYGNSTGVDLSDLTNIGVIGVGGGGDEPTLEAVNAVLYDDDVFADHTNSVQEVVDALNILNQSDGDLNSEINVSEMETLGIIATNNGYSNDEETYINYRINENFVAGGDGIYSNDLVELQSLVDMVDGRTIHIGEPTDDTYTYINGELYDAVDGNDTLNITSGTVVDLSAIHDIETIVLNSNGGSNDTNLGSEENRINIKDVLDITDGESTLVINDNDVNNNTVERVYLDASEFSTDGMRYSSSIGAYHVYTANDDSGVSIRIEEHILVE